MRSGLWPDPGYRQTGYNHGHDPPYSLRPGHPLLSSRPHRGLVGGALLLIFGGLVLFGSGFFGETAQHEAAELPSSNPESSTTTAPAELQMATGQVARESVDQAGAEATIASDPIEAADVATTVTLQGTWKVIDTLGQERLAENGSFVLFMYDAKGKFDVEVHEGRWSLELAADAEFDIFDVRLGGFPTSPISQTGDLRVPLSLQLDLVGRWAREIVLTVVDEETRAPLSGIIVAGKRQVYVPGEASSGQWIHPGSITSDPGRVLVRDARSPVILPVVEDASDREPLWVSAPGYGWGHIVVPRSVGGEFLIALRAAGDLEIRITNAPPGIEAHVRLRDPGTLDDEKAYEGVRMETTLRNRSLIEFESLPIGSYQVSLEVGHRYKNPLTIDGALAEVRAGARTVVELDGSDFEAPELATVSGRLVVPPQWGLTSYDLYFDIVGTATPDGRSSRHLAHHDMPVLDAELGSRSFKIEDLPVGGWEVRFNPLGTTSAFTLPVGGLRDLLIEVPLPADVTVHFKDSDTGDAIPNANVCWVPNREGLKSSGVLNQAGPQSDGSYRFRAPAGKVDVWVFTDRWKFYRQSFIAEPGDNDWTCETELATGLELSLSTAGTLLPVKDFKPILTFVGGDEQSKLVDEDDSGLMRRYFLSRPGLWRLEFTSPTGYRAIEPIELTLQAKTILAHTVDVIRE